MSSNVRFALRIAALVALLSLWVSGLPLLGQKFSLSVAMHDQRALEVRQPSPEVVETYKNDSDYEYDRYRQKESLWSIFLRWLFQNVAGGILSYTAVKVILIILAAVVFVIIALKLMGIEIKSLFLPTRKTYHLATHDMADDNIHDPSLGDALQSYIQHGRLREATRVMYLMVLQSFDKQKLIKWKPGKTNFDYYYELPHANLKQEFKKLVLTYEYVWYGEFPLTHEQFADVQKQFEQLHSRNTSKQ